MSVEPYVFGHRSETGDPVELSRLSGSNSRSHGVIFTDDSENGAKAYTDIADVIAHEATENDVTVFVVDPNTRITGFPQDTRVKHHSITPESLGSPARIPFPDGVPTPLELGVQTISSLLLSVFGVHGFSLEEDQKQLFFEMVKQAYNEAGGALTAEEAIANDPPTLNRIVENLIPLCMDSSQYIFADFGNYLSTLKLGGAFESLGAASGSLPAGDQSVHQYSIAWYGNTNDHIDPLVYQALVNSVLAEAHSRSEATWVVFAEYERLLTDGVSQRAIEDWLSHATGANTFYDIIVENVTEQATLPPVHNWYNEGQYARLYTTEAPPLLGMIPQQHEDWLDPSAAPNSQSALALPHDSESPYRIEGRTQSIRQ